MWETAAAWDVMLGHTDIPEHSNALVHMFKSQTNWTSPKALKL